MALALHRRDLLRAGAGLAALSAATAHGSGFITAPLDGATEPARVTPTTFRYCLNTSTVRGQKLTLPEQIDLAAKAGYDGIEPWLRDIQAFVDGGGNLADVRKKLEDSGLEVPSAIGFANWIVDDDTQRAAGLAAARHDMELLAAIGGQRIAAPPVGATQQSGLDLFRAAERYRALLELGEQTGVIPQLELWGFSKSLSRLGELALVATESGHPQACMLPDVYHIYKGGSDFHGLRLLNGRTIHVFHMNDYPAEPPREMIADAHRVYPGDGVAPLTFILRMLAAAGCRAMLSLELFNPDYWKQDPQEVANTGLARMKAAVARAAEDRS